MQPTWLLMLSWAALVVGLASATLVLVDEFVRGYRQPVRLLEPIWAVTALYLGPAALVTYRRWGRPQSRRWRERYGNPPKVSRNGAVAIHLYHCGAHCTLGAFIGTVIVFAVGIKIAGDRSWPESIGDYVGAVAVGFSFRYIDELRVRAAIRTFVRADLLPVSAFEFALFVVLSSVDHLALREAFAPNNPVFWFILQMGLVIGFFAAWPASSWVIRRGVRVELRRIHS